MSNSRANSCLFYSIFTGIVVCIISFLTWREFRLPVWECVVIGINVAAMFCMGLDKSLSRSASMRVPEVVMYVLAVLGGVPGLLLSIHVFKHKTRKAAFQFTLLVVVAAQAGMLWLLRRG